MDIKQLRYFMAIAEENQISRAAKRLHMAQPPLSLQLKQLEEELGVQLVERDTRSLRLTKAGHALYQRAEQIMRLMETTEKEIREFDEGLRGTLAIGSPPGIGHVYMPPRIQAFHTAYPQVDFLWREGNTYRVLELLEAGVIELGIVRLPADEHSYEQLPLLTEPWVAVTRRDAKRKRQPTSILLDDLVRGPLLMMHRQQSAQCHDMVWDALRRSNTSPQIVCESDNVTALLILVERGMGTAIVPQSTTTLMPSAALHAMDIADSPLQSSAAVVWRKGQRLSAPARQFLDTFRDQ